MILYSLLLFSQTASFSRMECFQFTTAIIPEIINFDPFPKEKIYEKCVRKKKF